MFANWSIITLMQKVGSLIQNRKGQAGLDLELDHLWNNQINAPAAKSGTQKVSGADQVYQQNQWKMHNWGRNTPEETILANI